MTESLPRLKDVVLLHSHQKCGSQSGWLVGVLSSYRNAGIWSETPRVDLLPRSLENPEQELRTQILARLSGLAHPRSSIGLYQDSS